MSKLQITLIAIVLLAAAIPLVIRQSNIAELRKEKERLQSEAAARPAVVANPQPAPELARGTGKAANDPDEESLDDMLNELAGGDFEGLKDAAAGIQAAQMEARLAKLKGILDFDEEQLGAIRTLALENIRKENERMTDFKALQDESPPVEPFDGINDLLRDDQVELYDEFVKKEDDAIMENLFTSMAYDELAGMQKVLNLSEDQKDKALAIFRAELNSEEEPVMNDDEGNKIPFRELMQSHNEERLKKLFEFLDSEQIQTYRGHLEKELDWTKDLEID